MRPTESGLVRVRKEWARTLCAGGAGARLVLKNSNRPKCLRLWHLQKGTLERPGGYRSASCVGERWRAQVGWAGIAGVTASTGYKYCTATVQRTGRRQQKRSRPTKDNGISGEGDET